MDVSLWPVSTRIISTTSPRLSTVLSVRLLHDCFGALFGDWVSLFLSSKAKTTSLPYVFSLFFFFFLIVFGSISGFSFLFSSLYYLYSIPSYSFSLFLTVEGWNRVFYFLLCCVLYSYIGLGLWWISISIIVWLIVSCHCWLKYWINNGLGEGWNE